jgi:hypothetical protein
MTNTMGFNCCVCCGRHMPGEGNICMWCELEQEREAER